ncbi:MAG: hypothetical protein LBB60_00335 [Desulfovibrio sp.]|jgi:hypothetical protein|nr:hypothetical protein [Desulfovibrio sp.]
MALFLLAQRMAEMVWCVFHLVIFPYPASFFDETEHFQACRALLRGYPAKSPSESRLNSLQTFLFQGIGLTILERNFVSSSVLAMKPQGETRMAAPLPKLL